MRVEYKRTRTGPLHLDVFRAPSPLPAPAPAPALLLFHGGAWSTGTPRQFHGMCKHLSRTLGIHGISVEYRLNGRHGTSPSDALEDARDAMRFVRRHSDALGIDARRVAAGGGSAGGHLAACLGAEVSLPDRDALSGLSARPDALVLLNPMLDLSPGRPDHSLVADQWQLLSPRHHVRSGMPPTLILNGTDDPEVPADTVNDFCRAVAAVGSDCEAQFFEGAGHGFFNPEVEGGRHVALVQSSIIRFLLREGIATLPAAPG